jgi:hypothetical protein
MAGAVVVVVMAFVASLDTHGSQFQPLLRVAATAGSATSGDPESTVADTASSEIELTSLFVPLPDRTVGADTARVVDPTAPESVDFEMKHPVAPPAPPAPPVPPAAAPDDDTADAPGPDQNDDGQADDDDQEAQDEQNQADEQQQQQQDDEQQLNSEEQTEQEDDEAEQESEEQNEAAEQQAQQDEDQAQQTEQQAGQ